MGAKLKKRPATAGVSNVIPTIASIVVIIALTMGAINTGKTVLKSVNKVKFVHLTTVATIL